MDELVEEVSLGVLEEVSLPAEAAGAAGCVELVDPRLSLR